MIKIRSKEISELKFLKELKKNKDSLEKITMHEKKAESDTLLTCELEGSYELLEYKLETNEITNKEFKYTLKGNKAFYKGPFSFPMNCITEAQLIEAFRELERYIDTINEFIIMAKKSQN